MAREEGFFDDLARGLADGTLTRGKALRLMGAALVGGALGSLGGVAAADEECKPLTRKCKKDAQCCSGNCSKSGTSRFGTCAAACVSNGGSCTENSDCCSGLLCNNGTCGAVGCSGSPVACDFLFTCGANNECACFNTTEGTHACVVDAFCEAPLGTCQSSNDCPAGTACVRTCCEFDQCAPLCGTTTSAALQAESGGGTPARKSTL